MDVVYYTNPGGREINEDSLFMTDGAYVVCDGLGGHDSGEVASNCAVKTMSELCNGNPPYSLELINTFYLRANSAVIALKEKALTTIVGGFVRDGVFYYQGVGDSRLYYFRNGKKFAQTKDDSVCQAAVDLGSLDYNDIRTSEDRSRRLKVLGNDPELKIMRKYEPIIMQEKDAFLVCSDGFWEHVLDEEMEETLQQSYDVEEWLNRMLKIQYERAKNRDDNYTVICCIVEAKDVIQGVDPSGVPMAAEVPISRAEMLRDEIHTEDFESMPLKEVEFDPDNTTDEGASAVQGGLKDMPYNVPYAGDNDAGAVTERMPDLSGRYGNDESYDGEWSEDDDYYEDEPEEKRGFFASLFRRR